MTLSQTLLSGNQTEWALVRAHPSESAVQRGPEGSYYGIQISGGKVASVTRTTEILASLFVREGEKQRSGVDTIDLNCGCPLDMVFKTGAGSALLDNVGKLVKMARGMVAVSGDIPVSCKIRMGVKDGKNTATKIVRRMVAENVGLSAITLHGRTRMQRYARAADWEYIAECAATIKRAKEEMARMTDGSYENLESGDTQRMAFLGYVPSLTDLTAETEMCIITLTFTMRLSIPRWIPR